MSRATEPPDHRVSLVVGGLRHPLDVTYRNAYILASVLAQNDVRRVVLDLDHTLIHSVTNEEHREAVRSGVDVPGRHHPHPSGFRVFERPGLAEFIDTLFDNGYEVYVWTDSLKHYAEPVTNIAFNGRHPPPRGLGRRRPVELLTRQRCDRSQKAHGNRKHLSVIGPGAPGSGKTVLIDDVLPNHMPQPDWSIGLLVPAFRAGNVDDNVLHFLANAFERAAATRYDAAASNDHGIFAPFVETVRV